MNGDRSVNQDSIFKENINDKAKIKLGTSKSNKQQQQVTLNSHYNNNKSEEDPVAIKDVISEENINDNVKNGQESKKSDENRKRTILNNYNNEFQYQCPYGNSKINKVTVSPHIVFRMEYVNIPV